MSAGTLAVRIKAGSKLLSDVGLELDKNASKLPPKLETGMRSLVDLGARLDATLDVLVARDAMLRILSVLETRADAAGLVNYAGVQLPFWQARLLAVQSYLATAWSAADLLSSSVGAVYCLAKTGRNPAHPAKLWEHFVKDDGTTTAALHTLSRECFGLPIAVSYAIRNLFIHDGGQLEGASVFQGSTPADKLDLSTKGWDAIMWKVTNQYKVLTTETRAPETWPWSGNDLRAILDICNREMDDFLGVLVGTACGHVRDQVGFLLGLQ